MLFNFSEEQIEIADLVADWVNRNYTTENLRQAWSEGFERSRDDWDSIADLGIGGILAPEDHGGMDAEFSDYTLAFERLGAGGFDEQFAVTSAVVLPALLRSNNAEVQAKYIETIAEGRLICTLALEDSDYVVDAGRADLILYVSNGELRLAEPGSYRAEPVESQDPTRRLHECAFDDSKTLLVSEDPELLAWVRAASATVTAVQLNGLSMRMLDMSVDYVKERKQFGRIIGSFQAVKHKLADVMIQLEASRSLTWFAMYALGEADQDWAEAAAMAKSLATSANQIAANAALQSHGGIGFTKEHDLHLFLYRSQAMRAVDGSVHTLRQRVGKSFMEEVSSPLQIQN